MDSKILAIQSKLDYITPNMVTSAVSFHIGLIENGYNIVKDIIDTYTYNFPEIIIVGDSFRFCIIDPRYKNAVREEFKGNDMAIYQIEHVIDESNLSFLNNMAIVMSDILQSPDFVDNMRLLIDKSMIHYLRAMNELPIYELIHFMENRQLKNFIMVNFFVNLLLHIEGQKKYTIFSVIKTKSDVITPEICQSIGVKIPIEDILETFIKKYVKEKPEAGTSSEGQISVEWLEIGFEKYLNDIFHPNVQYVIIERLTSMNKNLAYMCSKLHATIYPNKQPTKKSLTKTIDVLFKNIEKQPPYTNIYFPNSTLQNIAMSYIY